MQQPEISIHPLIGRLLYICLKKDIIDIDETAYAARYIKYRGFRKCAV